MRAITLLLVCVFIMFSFITLSVGLALAQDDAKYLLGEGDRIEISVWNDELLKREVNVRPDGWISFPLAGEVYASGLYPEVLASQITQKLKKFIKQPRVSVIVLEYKSKKVLVLGQVKKPGVYQLDSKMTAFDSIGAAGGYEKHAQLKSILVVRNGSAEKPEFYLANLYKLIHDGNRSEDVVLQPGDIVYVPQNFIGDIGDALDFFMARVKPAADTYALYAIAQRS